MLHSLPVFSGSCTGCSACAAICPKNAISMKENQKGFLEPLIDKSSCINCGACERACPVLNKNEGNASTPQIFTFSGDEKLLEKSSSGGVFTILAEQILKRGGVVVGAAWA